MPRQSQIRSFPGRWSACFLDSGYAQGRNAMWGKTLKKRVLLDRQLYNEVTQFREFLGVEFGFINFPNAKSLKGPILFDENRIGLGKYPLLELGGWYRSVVAVEPKSVEVISDVRNPLCTQ